MKCIDPTAEAMKAFLDNADNDVPIVMINLLKFRAQANYPAAAAAAPCSGREAYARYAAVAGGKVAEVGGSKLWMGRVAFSLIAPPDESWDEAFLVHYPAKRNLLRMLAMPDYRAALVHRIAALEDSRLIMTLPYATGGKPGPMLS